MSGILKASQKRHEARAFDGGVDIQAAGQHGRLVGHDAHRLPGEAREPHHEVLGKMLLDFHKVAVVHNP